MVRLFSHFFIKKGMSEDDQRNAWGMVCGTVGIILNLLLFAGKGLAGLLSGSLAILADALNNLSDAASSIITLVGFSVSKRKADPGHPFGHGRAEYVSGFIVSVMMIVMAFELARDSIVKIIHPEDVSFSWLILGILIGSILVKCYMAWYNRSTGKRIQSVALEAVAKDSMNDCISTTVVLIAAVAIRLSGLTLLDGICGLLVACFIAYQGILSARDTLNPLLGQAPDPAFVQKIRDIMANESDQITGIHDLIVNDYGPGKRIVSLHAEVPANGNIVELHEVIDKAEEDLEAKLHCLVTIHMDPIITDDPHILSLKDEVYQILQSIAPYLTMHDFRVVPGKKRPKLIFDVVVPFGFELSSDELQKRIEGEVHRRIGSQYEVMIHFDTDYTVTMAKR
jgi:cation diffusion facilitator family transporter